MLNDVTKRKINSLRQILVGKVPDPKSQVEQITNALIYKYMDDMDRQAEVFSGKPSFFVKEYEKYAWRNLMSPKLGGQERMNLYMEALEKMGMNKNLSPIFRDILKNSYVPYRSPETLNLFLSEIDGFAYDHSEDLGDAFEYLLSIMGAQGDAGQFRTPRHIIDFIVAVVDPKKDQKILDPACGTAGFLISAYKHILKQNQKENPGDMLTHDERANLHKNFIGYDISPEMAKLSRVNMFLHNFPDPKIYEYDTLSSEERWQDNFDVIIANPPFMSPKGGIIPHKKFRIPANRAEVLFTDYIVEHLKPKGRAGIIVPEGIIFKSENSYKELRKMLVEDGLFAVASLPAGIFQPYSGVKTSVLLFDNSLAKQSKEILFVKIENDGYDLGAQRRPISKNDLPEALTILNKWKTSFVIPAKAGIQCVAVQKTKIAESGDYNLSGDRYRTSIDYVNAKWPMVELGEVVETISPEKRLLKSEYSTTGIYPIIDQSQEEIAGYTDVHDSVVNITKPVVIFGDHTCAVKYSDKPFAQGADGIKILETHDNLLPKFFYYFLKTNPIISDGYKRHFSKLKKSKIPLPPIEIQKQIVTELDGYQNIITGAKQITANWKPKIEIDPIWEKVRLEEVAKINDENINVDKIKEYNYIDISSVENETGKISIEKTITGKDLPSRARRKVEIGDVLLSTVRPNLKAFAYLSDLPKNPVASTGFAVISPKDMALSQWIYFLSLSDFVQEQMIAQMGKGSYPSINQTDVENLEIPLPPLATQKQIVEKIESERTLVESAKKLIEIYEMKMKDVIEKLWN